ncbi:MAG: lipopolysaccharide assembly protein LapA domain-containing protein [Desulfuromonadaceae bacterium]|nr:lipopolysaccharide assembly protein LapA domain-containing protein [Desulfuromonadaceae bacterium]
MKFLKMFLALIGLALLFIFVRDNTEKIVVEFWNYATPEIELFLILIITFVLGMIVASFGSTLKIMQLKRQLKNARSGVSESSKENKKGKNKKDKYKKPQTEPLDTNTSSTSETSSSSAGSYTASSAAAGAAGAAYTTGAATDSATDSTTASAPDSGGSTTTVSDAQFVEGQEEEASLAADEVLSSASDPSEDEKTSINPEKPTVVHNNTSADVIALPADEITPADEDKKEIDV